MLDLEASCRSAWQGRDQLLKRLKDLAPNERVRMQTDMLDLAILSANLRVQLAKANEQHSARQSALQMLEEAEALFGPSPGLLRERQLYAKALGLTELERRTSESVSLITPRNAWEHYSLGRSYLYSGELALAAAEFQKAVDLEPSGLWPNYYKALCAFRLKQYDVARVAFSVCIGAAAQNASPQAVAKIFYNRALAGNDEEARADYTHALTLDPTLGVAAFNRGILNFKEKRYAKAIHDLKLALNNGVEPAVVYFHLAMVYEAQEDRPAAVASLRRALQYEPGHKDARLHLNRLEPPR
jgi:tetratricopeptide (TPR) repeat protein